MKKRWIACLMMGILLLGLTACKENAAREAPPVALPEAGDEAFLTEDTEVRRQPEEIALHPFTQEELSEGQAAVEAELEKFAGEPGVTTYTVERVAFDPIMTDVHNRQEMVGAPVSGWTEREYYANRMSFAVTYSAAYDHEKTFQQDVQHGKIGIHLAREKDSGLWTVVNFGLPVEEHSGEAMTQAELDGQKGVSGRLLGGYLLADGTRWLYFYNEDGCWFLRK